MVHISVHLNDSGTNLGPPKRFWYKSHRSRRGRGGGAAQPTAAATAPVNFLMSTSVSPLMSTYKFQLLDAKLMINCFVQSWYI
jgi:hypothetical protein